MPFLAGLFCASVLIRCAFTSQAVKLSSVELNDCRRVQTGCAGRTQPLLVARFLLNDCRMGRNWEWEAVRISGTPSPSGSLSVLVRHPLRCGSASSVVDGPPRFEPAGCAAGRVCESRRACALFHPGSHRECRGVSGKAAQILFESQPEKEKDRSPLLVPVPRMSACSRPERYAKHSALICTRLSASAAEF